MNEVGTGLGPTLGFFSELAESIRSANEGTLWKQCSDNTIYPRPMNLRGLEPEKVREICSVFKLAGTFAAKSIVDDRRIELPFSPLMWDLLFDRKPTLYDLKKYDENLFTWMCEC